MTATRSFGRAMVLYALASVVAIAMAAGVLMTIYSTPAEQRAVWLSAGVGLVVQILTFGIARVLVERGHGIAGWGLGAVICFVALIVFGFVSRALGLPSNAALLSLATYFFLTELIEPPLLNV
ncbi:hypothetical protein BH11GEM2_BH11GEM2_03240 [soil metagenome]